jgi:hypothetical protein
MAVTHTKVSVISDGADTSLVQPSNWNADHTINSILPATDSTYDLGSASYRWQDAYVEGVKFPATQVASSDVNCLDDYEEGDYTPVANVVTFSAATGRYTKVGRLVTVQFDVTWPTTSDTNEARISLPLTNGPFGAVFLVLSDATGAYFAMAANGSYLYWGTNSTWSAKRVMGSITYSV